MDSIHDFLSLDTADTKSGEFDLFIDGEDITTDIHVNDYLHQSLCIYLKIKSWKKFDNFRPFFSSTYSSIDNIYHTHKNLSYHLHSFYSKYREAVLPANPLNSKFTDLIFSFRNEFSLYSNYISSKNHEEIFTIVSNEIVKLNYVDFTVELAPSNSFKIKLLLHNNLLLVISKPFHCIGDLGNDEVVFSLFLEKQCLISDVIKISELVNKVDEFED